MARRLVPLLLSAACVAPADDAPAPDPAGGGGKEDRGEPSGFREVDPERSTAAFRDYVGRAIARLERDDSEIARLTAQSIRAGRVKIDELVDLTCWDFERARQELTSVDLDPEDWQDLGEPGSDVAAALTAELDGYMWSDRIYVSRGQTTRRLAATLVHEVNHVINASEQGYWDDYPTSAFLHEYRAFHAEALYDPAWYDDVDLIDHVIELYELDAGEVPADVLDAPLTPRLLPDADAWRDRDVAADAEDVDEDCPGW